MKRLAIISTHPIQYYAPVFRQLQAEGFLDIKVFYTRGDEAGAAYDRGFGKAFQWDVPLLDGYAYEWVKNTAADKGSHHFFGIANPDLIQRITSWQPDALLIYGWANYSHLKVMRHFNKVIPVFFRGDSTLLDVQGSLKAMAKKLLLCWVYTHIDFALYVGSRNRSYFSHYGLKDKQLLFAPHAIDNQRFAQTRDIEVLDFRNRLHLSENDILVLFAGKFEAKKDPLLLLNAFIQLQQELEEEQNRCTRESQLQAPKAAAKLRLLMVGNGVLEQALKTTASTYPDIHFLDFQNQQMMPVVYQAADLFCLPSAGPAETWGLAVNEAMACSKPILVADQVGCAVDLVQEGINGAVFSARSAASLQQHLNILVKQGRTGLAEMGRCSKSIIDQWTIEEQVRAITIAVGNYG